MIGDIETVLSVADAAAFGPIAFAGVADLGAVYTAITDQEPPGARSESPARAGHPREGGRGRASGRRRALNPSVAHPHRTVAAPRSVRVSTLGDCR